MCAIDAKYIYVTGGYYASDGIERASCFRYDFANDLWQDVPHMHQPRISHSSCHLAGYLYVFAGMGDNSVEKLALE